MNGIIALKFHISLNATTWIGRIGMLVVPARHRSSPTAGPSRCNSDRAVLEHGIETGIINTCRTAPFTAPAAGTVDDHGHPSPGIPGRRRCQADEQARLGEPTGHRQLPVQADPAPPRTAALNRRRTPPSSGP